MTKKHFEKIAELISNNINHITGDIDSNFIHEFSNYLESINKNFDRNKFLFACKFYK